MLAFAVGITGVFVLAAYWVLGLWVPWKWVLLVFGLFLLVELLLAAVLYWFEWRYE